MLPPALVLRSHPRSRLTLSSSQVQLLLDAGADLHLVTNCHETPLHLAVREAHLAVTQLLGAPALQPRTLSSHLTHQHLTHLYLGADVHA